METIRGNTDSSMYRIGMGFVAIHQFASNLFTMSWRPEFRTIRVSMSVCIYMSV